MCHGGVGVEEPRVAYRLSVGLTFFGTVEAAASGGRNTGDSAVPSTCKPVTGSQLPPRHGRRKKYQSASDEAQGEGRIRFIISQFWQARAGMKERTK